MPDQSKLNPVTPCGIRVCCNLLDRFSRQILSFHQAQQVAFLQIRIAGESDQNLRGCLFEELLDLVPRGEGGFFRPFG